MAYRVVQKPSPRLRELTTELGASSHNLANVFWKALYMDAKKSTPCPKREAMGNS